MYPTIIISNTIRINKNQISPLILREIKEKFSFKIKTYSGWDKKFNFMKQIEHNSTWYEIPKGGMGELKKILSSHGINKLNIDDMSTSIPIKKIKFTGQLYDHQIKPVQKALENNFCHLSIPTGGGKTIIALKIIEQQQQKVLIIVPTKLLLHQWKDRIKEFMNYDCGLIGDGKFEIKDITVSIFKSCFNKLNKIKNEFGFVIVDECHRIANKTFTHILNNMTHRYGLGLSATPKRKDKMTKLIHYFTGPRVCHIPIKKLQASNQIMKCSLIKIKTSFKYNYQDDYTKMLNALVKDEERNADIVIALREYLMCNPNECCLVLSDRKEHCQALQIDFINEYSFTSKILTSETKNKERIIKRTEKAKLNVLFATSQLIGEGFDLPIISALFLTTPIGSETRLLQYVGRILRKKEGKENAMIYDFVDEEIGVLQASFKRRLKYYKKLGINNDNY